MYDVNFKRNYGYLTASPFWLVWREDGNYPRFQHPTKAEAEQEAARIAALNPGTPVFVMGVIAEIHTSSEILGERFDPNKEALIILDEPVPETPSVPPKGEPAFVGEADEQPF